MGLSFKYINIVIFKNLLLGKRERERSGQMKVAIKFKRNVTSGRNPGHLAAPINNVKAH